MGSLADLLDDNEDDTPVAADGIPADDPPIDSESEVIGDDTPVTGGPELPAQLVAPPAELDRGFDFTRESYAWAQDVFYVYDNLDATAKVVKLWPASRRALHKHAKSNLDSFMGQLVPKAMQLYEKARDKNGDLESVIVEERKSINVLRGILRDAIEEAKGVTA